jgi:glucose/arabinose dehydrogenase
LLDLVFYEGDQFPPEYRGSLFVALKGSLEPLDADRLQTRARAVQGRPARRLSREFRDRLLGVGRTARRSLGRPAALAVAKDGALLVADDTGGTIWRISYKGTAEHAGVPAETSGSQGKSRAAGR